MSNYFLNLAYEEALLAYNQKEVPVGCVIVKDNIVISRSHNMTNQSHSPLSHAELNALSYLNYEDLSSSLVFYITCEPCVMCLGILSRLKCTVFFGCKNERFGGTSVVSCKEDFLFNLEDERCFKILQDFYKRENENISPLFRKKKM